MASMPMVDAFGTGGASAFNRIRPLSGWMRGFLYASTALFFVTSVQLLVLAGQTDTYFAWSLSPPSAAANLGMAFLAVGVGQAVAARQKTWAAARVAVIWLWAICALVLIVTLLYADEFHFSSADPTPRVAAWLWVATFAGMPAAAVLVTWRQLRGPGVDPTRDTPMPGDMRISLLIQVVLFGLNGVLFLLVPGIYVASWTFPATPLSIRVSGAGFLAFAVLFYHASRERDLSRVRPFGAFLTLFAMFELASLALYAGDARWGSPMTWLLIVWMVSLLPTGTHALFGRKVLRLRAERVQEAQAGAEGGVMRSEASVWRAPLVGDRPWFHRWPPGVPRSIAYPDILVSDLLRRTAEQHPGWTLMHFYGKAWSYKEVDKAADRFACGLRDLGVRPGDRVSVALLNTPHLPIVYFGAWRAGAVIVQTNPLYTAPELEAMFNDAGVETAITLDLFWPALAEAKPKTPVKRVVICDMADYMGTPVRQLYARKKKQGLKKAGHWPLQIPKEPWVHRYKRVAAAKSQPVADLPTKPHDVAVLQYTGGTTGRPKGAMLTHRNLVASGMQDALWYGEPGKPARVIGSAPAFHVYGLHGMLQIVFRADEGFMVPDPRDFGTILKLIDRHRATLFGGSPTMYVALLQHPKSKKYDLRSLEFCNVGSAALPSEVRKQILGRIGGRVVEAYGLSEAAPAISAPCTGPAEAGIGIPYCDTDVVVVDPEDSSRILPPGEVGELMIRGPQVMKGYWNKPEATAEILRDGWLLTGDLGRMNEDGSFAIVDRKKDMINASGFKVFPLEIEEVLYGHPAISEAAVVGVPDAYRGETVKAFVVLKAGMAAKADDILAFCKERLTAYKVPKLLEFVPDLPKTNVGKILRRELRDRERQKARSSAEPRVESTTVGKEARVSLPPTA